MPSLTQPDDGFPAAWRWDDDGDRIQGHYVETTSANTSYGTSAVVKLELAGGEQRSVWLLQTALREKFAQELKRRQADDFEPGELITIQRGEERESAAGRRYRSFSVVFKDAPRQSAARILGVATPAPGETPLRLPASRHRARAPEGVRRHQRSPVMTWRIQAPEGVPVADPNPDTWRPESTPIILTEKTKVKDPDTGETIELAAGTALSPATAELIGLTKTTKTARGSR
jgi:hypothetical protein